MSANPVANLLARILTDWAVRALVKKSDTAAQTVSANMVIAVAQGLIQGLQGNVPAGLAAIQAALGASADPAVKDILQTLVLLAANQVGAVEGLLSGTLIGTAIENLDLAILNQAVTIAQSYLPAVAAPAAKAA